MDWPFSPVLVLLFFGILLLSWRGDGKWIVEGSGIAVALCSVLVSPPPLDASTDRSQIDRRAHLTSG